MVPLLGAFRIKIARGCLSGLEGGKGLRNLTASGFNGLLSGSGSKEVQLRSGRVDLLDGDVVGSFGSLYLQAGRDALIVELPDLGQFLLGAVVLGFRLIDGGSGLLKLLGTRAGLSFRETCLRLGKSGLCGISAGYHRIQSLPGDSPSSEKLLGACCVISGIYHGGIRLLHRSTRLLNLL